MNARAPMTVELPDPLDTTGWLKVGADAQVTVNYGDDERNDELIQLKSDAMVTHFEATFEPWQLELLRRMLPPVLIRHWLPRLPDPNRPRMKYRARRRHAGYTRTGNRR